MRLLSITDKRLFNMYTGLMKEEEQDEKDSTQQTYLFTAIRLIIHLHNLPDKAPCKKKKILMKIETVRFVGRKYRGFMSRKKKKKRKLDKMQDVFAIFSLLASINSG